MPDESYGDLIFSAYERQDRIMDRQNRKIDRLDRRITLLEKRRMTVSEDQDPEKPRNRRQLR